MHVLMGASDLCSACKTLNRFFFHRGGHSPQPKKQGYLQNQSTVRRGMAALTLAPHAKLCCPRLCGLRQAVQPQALVAARRCAAKQLTTCSATGSATMASSSASPQYSALVGKQVLSD